MNTITHHYPVVSRVPIAAKGSLKYDLTTSAIDAWKKAAYQSGQNPTICLNVARELEIERDAGEIVHINKRTS